MTAVLNPYPLPELAVWSTLLVLTPALLAAGASFALRRAPLGVAWRVAGAAAGVFAAAAAAVATLGALQGPHANWLVRADHVTSAVLLLIALVGAAVIRYSSVYLRGDVGERRYVRRLLATLAAVSLVVVANNVALLLMAWAAASLALHGLLTHFGDRPVALAVAHKKFLLARLADGCMVGAAAAFGSTFSTLRIDVITARVAAGSGLPLGARLGILLVAAAALLKCAQLPFHGWLIQVMEAPTPVSALLHAGVVNLGGVVLVRFAPLVDRAVEVRSLLVVTGLLTAGVAALVMTTRVSIKVALAWSTCAQMGFMVMQCGLGLWQMALLHLLAHSLYKAHAFLGAGSTVRQTQRGQLVPVPGAPRLTALLGGTAIAVAATAAVAALWTLLPGRPTPSPAVWLLLGVVALALVPLSTPIPGRGVASVVAPALVVPLAYLALHEVAGRLVPHAATPPAALLVLVGVGFGALFAMQVVALVAPQGQLAQRMLPWLYGGLFLDEAFTRLAFRLVPPPAPPAAPAMASHALLPQRQAAVTSLPTTLVDRSTP